MKFDYGKVYTCLNADLLHFGSKVIFADDLYRLKKMVNENSSPDILSDVLEERQERRFVDQTGNRYLLAYLVKEPKKESYRPFDDEDEMYSFVVNHNYNWLINKQSNQKALFLGFTNLGKVLVGEEKLTLQQVFEQYDFYDWNNDVRYPCGMKAED